MDERGEGVEASRLGARRPEAADDPDGSGKLQVCCRVAHAARSERVAQRAGGGRAAASRDEGPDDARLPERTIQVRCIWKLPHRAQQPADLAQRRLAPPRLAALAARRRAREDPDALGRQRRQEPQAVRRRRVAGVAALVDDDAPPGVLQERTLVRGVLRVVVERVALLRDASELARQALFAHHQHVGRAVALDVITPFPAMKVEKHEPVGVVEAAELLCEFIRSSSSATRAPQQLVAPVPHQSRGRDYQGPAAEPSLLRVARDQGLGCDLAT